MQFFDFQECPFQYKHVSWGFIRIVVKFTIISESFTWFLYNLYRWVFIVTHNNGIIIVFFQLHSPKTT